MIDPKTKMDSFVRSMIEWDRTIGHVGMASLIQTAGIWFQGRASSNDYDCTKRWRKKKQTKARDCFYNAQTFCMDFHASCYFEGYVLALPTLDPVEHAWVVMEDGKVIDFTLEAMERTAKKKNIQCDTRQALYLGLEIPTGFICEKLLTSQWYESLAEEYFTDSSQIR